jgi:peroxiredoxin
VLRRIVLLGFVASLVTTPSFAALKPGDPAPDFSAQASLGGQRFHLLAVRGIEEGVQSSCTFYPAAFTTGCTIEAHDFADATDTYRALGATVIGVSHDNIDTLNKFSVSECRSKFAVAADTDQKIMRSYDAVLAAKPEYADRVSYVIAPDGHIIYAYQSLNPEKHVANTLAMTPDHSSFPSARASQAVLRCSRRRVQALALLSLQVIRPAR